MFRRVQQDESRPKSYRAPRKPARPRRLCIAIITSVVMWSVVWYLFRSPVPSRDPGRFAQSAGSVCPAPELQKDILVVLRTGATEALVKLPVHFQTILQCVDDYVIYSDMEEVIDGHHVFDVLSQVNHTLLDDLPEFELYKQLRTDGRAGLEYQTIFGSGPSGAVDNPGWKLDKWKFLPMVDRALQYRPHAKWFVFVEADTYMVWQNMVEYLSKFDARQPYYLGKHMYISDTLFGHGGSGFMLSNPAARKVSDHWNEHREQWDKFTREEWAGDMVLGKALKDVGVDMFWAFPHLQGDSLTAMDWNVSKIGREPWCFAPITFHHMAVTEFNTLWRFEQEWHRLNPTRGPLRFRDIFKDLVRPQLQPKSGDWDNLSAGTEYSEGALERLSEQDRSQLSPAEQEARLSLEKCQAACESKPKCIQFSYATGKCMTSDQLRLGHAVYPVGSTVGRGEAKAAPEPRNPIKSGWIASRVSSYVQQLDMSCDSGKAKIWVV